MPPSPFLDFGPRTQHIISLVLAVSTGVFDGDKIESHSEQIKDHVALETPYIWSWGTRTTVEKTLIIDGAWKWKQLKCGNQTWSFLVEVLALDQALLPTHDVG